jgi:hypothetical protein
VKKVIQPLLVVALSTPAMADWGLIFNYSDADVYMPTRPVSSGSPGIPEDA